MQADLGTLKDGADRDRERQTAFVAFVDAGARGLARQLRDALGVGVATMRAERAMRPMDSLQMLAGLVSVVVNFVGQVENWR